MLATKRRCWCSYSQGGQGRRWYLKRDLNAVRGQAIWISDFRSLLDPLLVLPSQELSHGHFVMLPKPLFINVSQRWMMDLEQGVRQANTYYPVYWVWQSCARKPAWAQRREGWEEGKGKSEFWERFTEDTWVGSWAECHMVLGRRWRQLQADALGPQPWGFRTWHQIWGQRPQREGSTVHDNKSQDKWAGDRYVLREQIPFIWLWMLPLGKERWEKELRFPLLPFLGSSLGVFLPRIPLVLQPLFLIIKTTAARIRFWELFQMPLLSWIDQSIICFEKDIRVLCHWEGTWLWHLKA